MVAKVTVGCRCLTLLCAGNLRALYCVYLCLGRYAGDRAVPWMLPLRHLLLLQCPCMHMLQIVVQQRSGNLVWEAGSDNRVVSVPEGAPVDSMITSVCAFNIIDTTAESKLQPVTADVLALLDAQLEEQAAAKEAQLAAAAERAAEEAEKARVGQAAAAVANAFATMGKLVCLLPCCMYTVGLLLTAGGLPGLALHQQHASHHKPTHTWAEPGFQLDMKV